MTMVNAIVQRKTGYLYADTAALDPQTGRVLFFRTKIFAGTLFPWAVGVTYTGDQMSWAYAIEPLKAARNVTALRKALPDAVVAFRSLAPADSKFRLTIVVWDARERRPRIFAIGDEADEQGVTPDEATEFDWIFGGPCDCRHLWEPGKPTDPKAFHPETTGITVMEDRRKLPEVLIGGGKAHYIVGGEIEMAEITRQGVRLYCIHQWPDIVGEPIRPLQKLET